MTVRPLKLLSLLALLFVPLTLGAEEAANRVLDGQGNAYEVRPGLYRDFVSELDETQPNNAVLQLRVWRTDGTQIAEVIPETLGSGQENSPTVAFDETAETLYAVWVVRRGLHSDIRIASYSAGKWTSSVSVSENTFPLKLNPSVIVTHDRLTITDPGGEPLVLRRTLVHMVWWHDSEQPAAHFATLFIEDGLPRYDDIEVYDLSLAVASLPSLPAPATPVDLNALQNPLVVRETGRGSVGAVFASPETNALVRVRIQYPSDPYDPEGAGEVTAQERGNIPDIGVVGRVSINPYAAFAMKSPIKTIVGSGGTIVQWWKNETENKIYYAETDGTSWSDLKQIPIADGLTGDQIVGMLQRLATER